eukprot:gnl/TRDRNA2_/TRDRNA2_137843_c1_seq3.p1 gnl/TRDRNA2_/TRDRNA2_137843_c1~~gnl/TRDRNA2_/TRDRNA2_137843_c1_seq3.p1  ORF type:complete len:173 (-),score=14.34 gnl/TRDRNA2_/TRDRNA2_137843_c1_seq3:68-586(-)
MMLLPILSMFVLNFRQIWRHDVRSHLRSRSTSQPRCLNCMKHGLFVIFFILMFAALYVFYGSPTDKNLDPAQSRNLNKECMLLGALDEHDLWHLLSALVVGFWTLLLLHVRLRAWKLQVYITEDQKTAATELEAQQIPATEAPSIRPLPSPVISPRDQYLKHPTFAESGCEQ